MTEYPTPRTLRTPPHLSLRNLRRVDGRTQAEICEAVTEILNRHDKPFTPGALSAIESGLRGCSTAILDALAVAYKLDPGDLVTDYEPQVRREQVPA